VRLWTGARRAGARSRCVAAAGSTWTVRQRTPREWAAAERLGPRRRERADEHEVRERVVLPHPAEPVRGALADIDDLVAQARDEAGDPAASLKPTP
jgi:hypothetical protein